MASSLLKILTDRIINDQTDGLVADAEAIEYISTAGNNVKAFLDLLVASIVFSYNGRDGVVLPESGDYEASKVTNDSAVPSATVDGALTYLLNNKVTTVFGRSGVVLALLGDYAASLVSNDSTVPGSTVKNALDNVDARVDSLEAIPAPVIFSVFGRQGNVVALLSDYADALIDNTSTIVGSTVKLALDTVDTRLVSLETAPPVVASVFGRVGAVVATLSDYSDALVTNTSAITGATVKDALDNVGAALVFLNDPIYGTHLPTVPINVPGAANVWRLADTFVDASAEAGIYDFAWSANAGISSNQDRDLQLRITLNDGVTSITSDIRRGSTADIQDRIDGGSTFGLNFPNGGNSLTVTLEVQASGTEDMNVDAYTLRFWRVKAAVAGPLAPV